MLLPLLHIVVELINCFRCCPQVLREPMMQDLLSRIISELTERFSVKMVRRLFGQPVGGFAAGGSRFARGVRSVRRRQSIDPAAAM